MKTLLCVFFLPLCMSNVQEALMNRIYEGNVKIKTTESYAYKQIDTGKWSKVRFFVSSSNANLSNLLYIIVRTAKDVESFSLPLNIEDRLFFWFENFICAKSEFTIDISGSRDLLVDFTLYASLEDITLRKSKSEFVAPNMPSSFVIKKPSSLKDTYAKIESNDSQCAMAIIQSKICSVDFANYFGIQGHYQTFSKKAGFMIYDSDYFEDNEYTFISIVVFPTDKECQLQSNIFDYYNPKPKDNHLPTTANQLDFEKYVTISIEDYGYKSSGFPWITLLVLGLVVVLVLLLVFSINCCKEGCSKTCFELQDNCKCMCSQLWGWICYPFIKLGEWILYLCKVPEIEWFRKEKITDGVGNKNNAQSTSRYNKLLFVILIFYIVPAVQLVFIFPIYASHTGNGDICYQNNWCRRPFWIFPDFNHVISNIGYLVLGILSLLITWYEQTKASKQKNKEDIENSTNEIKGLPKHFQLYYAMNLSIISEGVFSAIYHVCPNWLNFQFDITFMMIIASTGMLAMYQKRHPDLTPAAENTFIGIAFVIAVSVIIVFTARVFLVAAIFAVIAHLFITWFLVVVYCKESIGNERNPQQTNQDAPTSNGSQNERKDEQNDEDASNSNGSKNMRYSSVLLEDLNVKLQERNPQQTNQDDSTSNGSQNERNPQQTNQDAPTSNGSENERNPQQTNQDVPTNNGSQNECKPQQTNQDAPTNNGSKNEKKTINGFGLIIIGANIVFCLLLFFLLLWLESISFSHYLLVVFLLNFLLYLIGYLIFKCYSPRASKANDANNSTELQHLSNGNANLKNEEIVSEQMNCFAIIYFILSVVFWIFGGAMFFQQETTDWQVSPAASRSKNQECLSFLTLSYYDSHDIWHFLSAFGLFFSYLLMITLDKDLDDKLRKNIQVW